MMKEKRPDIENIGSFDNYIVVTVKLVGKQLFTTFGKTDLIKDNWRTTYARQTT